MIKVIRIGLYAGQCKAPLCKHPPRFNDIGPFFQSFFSLHFSLGTPLSNQCHFLITVQGHPCLMDWKLSVSHDPEQGKRYRKYFNGCTQM